jgi:hypothetical protein
MFLLQEVYKYLLLSLKHSIKWFLLILQLGIFVFNGSEVILSIKHELPHFSHSIKQTTNTLIIPRCDYNPGTRLFRTYAGIFKGELSFTYTRGMSAGYCR